jgi:hypothetical protein
LSSARSSTCLSRNSSPRLSVKSSNGLSSRSTKTGSSESLSSTIKLPRAVLIVRTVSHFPFAPERWKVTSPPQVVGLYFRCLVLVARWSVLAALRCLPTSSASQSEHEVFYTALYMPDAIYGTFGEIPTTFSTKTCQKKKTQFGLHSTWLLCLPQCICIQPVFPALSIAAPLS